MIVKKFKPAKKNKIILDNMNITNRFYGFDIVENELRLYLKPTNDEQKIKLDSINMWRCK